MIRQWDIVYENPPLSRDMVLFGLAIALHLPLFFLKMKAPPNLGEGEIQQINVGYIERIEQQVTIVRTPAPASAPVPAVNLEHYKKILEEIQKSRVRPLPPMTPTQVATIKSESAAANLKVAEAAHRDILQSRSNFKAPGAVPESGVALRTDTLAGGPIAVVSGPRAAPAPGPIRGKDSFAINPNQIKGFDDSAAGRLRTDGVGDTAVIKVAKRGQDDPSVFLPEVNVGGPSRGVKGPKSSFDGGGADLPESLDGLGGARLQAPTAARVVQRPKYTITGPLRDRRVLAQGLPEYPPALRDKGIEASVQLKFTVTPEGRVKDAVLVIGSSGYLEMDKAAMDAIRRWVFAPLDESRYEDQLGQITINFSMK